MKIANVMLWLTLSVFATLANGQSEYGPRVFPEDQKWTAIVAAYAPEIEAIDAAFEQLDHASISEVVTIKGVKYQLGTYKDEPVIIFTTGISVSNAAMTMQMALDYFPINKVVMMGVAGAINPEFSPGDIAIAERWYFHDESVYVNPNPDKPGQYILPAYYEQTQKAFTQRSKVDPHAPAYKNFDFMFPREVSIVKEGLTTPTAMPYFSVSKNLFELAKQASINVAPITMPSGKPIQIKLGGNGVTGSVFADSAKYRIWLQEVYNAQVTEMESAAVGQVCYINDVDWIIIRSVSDLAGAQKGQNEENVFEAIASGTGTKLLIALLDEIVKSKAH
ncbi:5'-methylthioadenosine/S-adenosylhomocysteine nucleosidase [Glaciecola sp. XM2]|nr:5'-methylthioadenosine/S-adenosylhomocysteine nucleosidase [Glaciecola sp. XM2]